jgi:LmbE family N-acetylglucosaminyl deacetylase
MRVVPLDDEQGHVALGLALRHLANTGIFLQATAHPDDENNGLLVMLNRGQGYRTALATATRGNGGQNEIGPEILEALGVLRTEELAALHRFDGAEQYFTRAVDFGYSFSNEETLEKWGRDETIGDFVRLIRMIRPDVVIAMRPDGAGGGQHHQVSAMLAHEAVKMSGDSTKYPEQLHDGLRPWRPRKFYFTTGYGFGDKEASGTTARINLASYDQLLGKTYFEIGTEARSMHKCQGMAQLLALPGPAATAYGLAESSIPGPAHRDEKSLFDGIDHSIEGLVQFAGHGAPNDLIEGLAALAAAVQKAQKTFDGQSDGATVQPLLTGLHAVRALRGRLPAMPIEEASGYEIDFRLRQKEHELQQSILIAAGMRIEVLADDGVVVPGQPEKISLIVVNHGAADVSVKEVKFEGFDSDGACTLIPVAGTPPVSILKQDAVARCDVTLKIPANARVTEPYWHRQGEAGRYTFDADAPFGLPYRPTPFHARVTLAFPGGEGLATEGVVAEPVVQHRYEGNIFSGEKRMDVLVAPALSVRVEPGIAIVPVASAHATTAHAARPATGDAPLTRDGEREVRVTIVNDSLTPAESVIKLEAPERWSVTPVEQTVKIARQQEAQTVRFQVRPAPDAAIGEYRIRASASAGALRFGRGYQVIEYPHIRRQHIYHDAELTLKVVDVKTVPDLTVGYVMGVGDEVPRAIEQLGSKLELLGPDDLAWGNLTRFDAIVTGVRAYERRGDLRANNGRLLAYVRDGGTLIVQYNKFEFNKAQYGPYPAKVSANRVTDELSPVTLLAPSDSLLNFPNEITAATWKGWVQERGLYFLGDRDPRYRDLVRLEDPFPSNAGEKLGALVETAYGKGRWVYVALALWRQLPAGNEGAYQILANLISLGKAPR